MVLITIINLRDEKVQQGEDKCQKVLPQWEKGKSAHMLHAGAAVAYHLTSIQSSVLHAVLAGHHA